MQQYFQNFRMAAFDFKPADVIKYDLFHQDDDDLLFEYKRWALFKTISSSLNLRRDSVPNVSNYLDTIRMMTIPDDIDNCRTHFRVSHTRLSHQTVTPENSLVHQQHVVYERASLSKSTVHGIVQDVSSAMITFG